MKEDTMGFSGALSPPGAQRCLACWHMGAEGSVPLTSAGARGAV